MAKCSMLEALPMQLGSIELLTELNACEISVPKSPDLIGDLSKLVKQKLDYNKKLEYLPNTICNLRALEVLTIDNCSNVEALPVELGNIESPRELRAGGLTVSKLPDSICNMRSLEILDIIDCRQLERLPGQLWRLTRLFSLKASRATLIKELPDIESRQTSLSLTLLDLSEIIFISEIVVICCPFQNFLLICRTFMPMTLRL